MWISRTPINYDVPFVPAYITNFWLTCHGTELRITPEVLGGFIRDVDARLSINAVHGTRAVSPLNGPSAVNVRNVGPGPLLSCCCDGGLLCWSEMSLSRTRAIFFTLFCLCHVVRRLGTGSQHPVAAFACRQCRLPCDRWRGTRAGSSGPAPPGRHAPSRSPRPQRRHQAHRPRPPRRARARRADCPTADASASPRGPPASPARSCPGARAGRSAGTSAASAPAPPLGRGGCVPCGTMTAGTLI